MELAHQQPLTTIEGEIVEPENLEICILCQRQRPIFLVDNDDMILRLPERFLPPFLKSLKQDYLQKRPYLKLLRINSKMISCCACHYKMAHSYCTTAFVLRSQKIYCRDCYSHFRLYVKSDRLFTSNYLTDLVKFAMMTAVFAFCIYTIYLLDRELRGLHVQKQMNQERQDLGQPANVTFEAAVSQVDNLFIMVPLQLVLVVIGIWCFYIHFLNNYMKTNRTLWVEVQDYFNPDYHISRNRAKKNLHLVAEITQKLKSYNSLFDKYWYRQRELQYIESIILEQSVKFHNGKDEDLGEWRGDDIQNYIGNRGEVRDVDSLGTSDNRTIEDTDERKRQAIIDKIMPLEKMSHCGLVSEKELKKWEKNSKSRFALA